MNATRNLNGSRGPGHRAPDSDPIEQAVPRRRPARGAPPIRLTPREREVLALLCQGFPNKLIQRRLRISAGTVKTHVGSILRELGVSSRLQAVVVAREWGLLKDAPDQAVRRTSETSRSSRATSGTTSARPAR